MLSELNVWPEFRCNLSHHVVGVLLGVGSLAVIMQLLHILSLKHPKKPANSSDVLQWVKISMALSAIFVVVPLQIWAFNSKTGSKRNQLAAVLLQHLIVDFYPLGQLALAVTRLRICLCRGNTDVLVTKLSAILTLGLCFLPLAISTVVKAFLYLSDQTDSNSIVSARDVMLDHYCMDSINIRSKNLHQWYNLFVIVAYDVLPLVVTFLLYGIIQKHYRKSQTNMKKRQHSCSKIERKLTIVQHNRKTGRSIGLSMFLLSSTVTSAWLPYVVLKLITWFDAINYSQDIHHTLILFFTVILYLIGPIGEGMFLSQKRDNIKEGLRQILIYIQERFESQVDIQSQSIEDSIFVENAVIYKLKRTGSSTVTDKIHTGLPNSEMPLGGWTFKRMRPSTLNSRICYYADESKSLKKKVRFSTTQDPENVSRESGSESSLSELGFHLQKRRKSSTVFHPYISGVIGFNGCQRESDHVTCGYNVSSNRRRSFPHTSRDELPTSNYHGNYITAYRNQCYDRRHSCPTQEIINRNDMQRPHILPEMTTIAFHPLSLHYGLRHDSCNVPTFPVDQNWQSHIPGNIAVSPPVELPLETTVPTVHRALHSMACCNTTYPPHVCNIARIGCPPYNFVPPGRHCPLATKQGKDRRDVNTAPCSTCSSFYTADRESRRSEHTSINRSNYF